MTQIHTLSFKELGITIAQFDGLNALTAYKEIVQIACDFLMDTVYCEFNEPDVIPNHRDISVDWVAHTVLVPVNQVYKPEYLN